MVDWRTPLAGGTLAQDARSHASRCGMPSPPTTPSWSHACAAAGVALDGPLQGSAIATDLALSHGAHQAAQALVRAGAPVAHDALDYIDSAVSPELVGLLLERGAEPTRHRDRRMRGLRRAGRGTPDRRRLRQGRTTTCRPLCAPARDGMLAELEAALVEVHAGRLTHYLGPAGLAKRVDHLQSFSL